MLIKANIKEHAAQTAILNEETARSHGEGHLILTLTLIRVEGNCLHGERMSKTRQKTRKQSSETQKLEFENKKTRN